jgi:hypothetical protein
MIILGSRSGRAWRSTDTSSIAIQRCGDSVKNPRRDHAGPAIGREIRKEIKQHTNRIERVRGFGRDGGIER